MDATPPTTSSAPAPTSTTSSNDKLWIVISHLSPFVGLGVIAPLVVWLVKKDESELIAYHAKEALNFHISVFLGVVACWILMFVLIGMFLLPLLVLAALILSVIAAIKSANGERYRYPFAIRLVK
jgi:uncharacterized Tic20 family protein